MDIHHAMMVRNKPDRLYEVLTQQSDLEVWMGAPTLLHYLFMEVGINNNNASEVWLATQQGTLP